MNAGDTPELCIKPALGSWGLHKPLPCIANGGDLMLYGLALQDRWPSLPANMLTTPHPEIDLPPGSDRQLMVEPYIHVARSVQPLPLPFMPLPHTLPPPPFPSLFSLAPATPLCSTPTPSPC